MWGSKIVNYSLSKRRRLELTLKVREEDADIAIGAIVASLAGDSRILKTPAPLVRVTSLAESAATLNISAWTKPDDLQAVLADEYVRLLKFLRDSELLIL